MTTSDEIGGRLLALADQLDEGGVFADPRWRDVVMRVHRHAFLPDVIWAPDAEDPEYYVPVTRDDPYWWANAYVDASVVTQVDDGLPAGTGGRGIVPTSSASQPSIVVRMLHALDVAEGMRILEIGTATGYNAALLCECLGDDLVTSIEVDPALGAQARSNLHRLGYSPGLVVGDGAAGVPQRAPYDRVLSTVAARKIPWPWVEQTRPGGLIVTPWGAGWARTGLLRLVVGQDGTAVGRIIGDAAFMWLREQRVSSGDWRDFVDEHAADVEAYRSKFDPIPVCDADASGGLALAVAVLVPDVSYARYKASDGSGEASVYIYDQAGSWGLIEYTPGALDYEAYWHGPRHLWDEIEAAYRWWESAGSPDRDRFGVTVSSEGQTVWLDTPSNAIV